MSQSAEKMLGSRRTLRLSSLLALLGAAACTSVLGIEDLHEGPRPGSGGDVNSAGENGAGKTSTAGKSDSGGTTGATGGSTSGGTVSGGGGGGGEGATGGAPDTAGAPTDGGAMNPADRTVRGKVIDFWGHGVPNISLQIGAVVGSTDTNGDFSFEDVPDTYTVNLVFTHTDEPQIDAWSYQGLTRRDPTLQMYWGSEPQSSNLEITFTPQPTLADNQTIWVAFGGKDGENVYEDIWEGGYSSTSAYWYGPPSTTQEAHALLWQMDVNSLPTSYVGYDNALIALTNQSSTTAKSVFDLSPETIDTANMQGKVTPRASAGRGNQVYATFTGHARMQLVDDNGPNTFNYILPLIANTSFTVAATEGSLGDGYAVVHQDGLAAAAKPDLTIPAMVTLLTPAGAATGVGPTTKFSLQNPATTTGPFVYQFYSQGDLDYQTVYVVTAEKQIVLPDFGDLGFSLYKNNDYYWSVATHGNFASVDALASAGGFLDEFSYDERTARGPHTKSGEFTDSVARGFTTAP